MDNPGLHVLLNSKLHPCKIVSHRHPWYTICIIGSEDNQEIQVKEHQLEGNIPNEVREGKSVVKRSDRERYEITKRPDRNYRSLDKGDETAKALRKMTLADVYKLTGKVSKRSQSDLKKSYSHLTVGIQRMTLGNMIRASKYFNTPPP